MEVPRPQGWCLGQGVRRRDDHVAGQIRGRATGWPGGYLVFLSCLTLALSAFFFFFWVIWRRIFMRDCLDFALGIPSFL